MTGKFMRTAAVLMLMGALSACKSSAWYADPSAVYFPLRPRMMWMYRVQSKSQRATYTVTDMVVGPQYVPALKVTGEVVQEFYNFDRAGLRPLLYLEKDGYLTRVSGLDYVGAEIKPPSWGRSEESDFLPHHLVSGQSWTNKDYPYGRFPGAFDILQIHKTFQETGEVAVPAGHFHDCIRIETQASYEGGAYAQQKMALKLEYVDWYAPNVGLVRTLAYEGGPNGPEMERVELVKFDNGAAPSTVVPPPHQAHANPG